jgi:hypothetical protein
MKRMLFGLLMVAACSFSLGLLWDVLHQAKAGALLGSKMEGASDRVAEAATAPVLSGVVISGPSSAATGQCVRLIVVAIDQNRRPFTLTQNEPVFMRLFSAASVSFSANSACTNPQKGFMMVAGSPARNFYAVDSAAESFLVQPVLNPHSAQPVYGTDFTMNFTGTTATPTPTPTATSTPSGLSLTYEGCWYKTAGNRYQALDFQLASPATLILQGELYTGSGCLPANFSDQLNDFGTPESFGTFGYVFWFTNRANLTDVSVVWSFSDTSNNPLWSSGCLDYSTAPLC